MTAKEMALYAIRVGAAVLQRKNREKAINEADTFIENNFDPALAVQGYNIAQKEIKAFTAFLVANQKLLPSDSYRLANWLINNSETAFAGYNPHMEAIARQLSQRVIDTDVIPTAVNIADNMKQAVDEINAE